MKIIRRIMIAFALYSRIPMPHFSWEKEDRNHAIAFLPFVGIVPAAVMYGALALDARLQLPVFVLTMVLLLIPLLITGGFHIDGYLDVKDALSAYADPKKSLEIMKDPHIGAFAVISLAKTGLLFAGATYLLIDLTRRDGDYRRLYLFALLFVLSRACCGITSVVLQKAKKDGMLQDEVGEKNTPALIFLIVEAAAAFVAMLCFSWILALACAAGLFAFSVNYRYLCMRRFGGVSGDTAGYYVVASELLMVVILAVCSTLLCI